MPVSIGGLAAGGSIPGIPTIGTATGGDTQATVAFTVPAYTGKGGAVVYRVLSTPGSVPATGSASPITVTGLTNGVSYTFAVRTETSYGTTSGYSSASNAVTPVAPPVPPSFPPTFPPTFPPDFPPVFPPACTYCESALTDNDLIPCGCVDTPGGYRQKYFLREYYTTDFCEPSGCVGCSCNFTVDSLCVASGDPCFE